MASPVSSPKQPIILDREFSSLAGRSTRPPARGLGTKPTGIFGPGPGGFGDELAGHTGCLFLPGIPHRHGLAQAQLHLECTMRVQAASLSWGERNAWVNSISPGIIVTALARHELALPIWDFYRTMVDAAPAKRMASPDEGAVLAASKRPRPSSAF